MTRVQDMETLLVDFKECESGPFSLTRRNVDPAPLDPSYFAMEELTKITEIWTRIRFILPSGFGYFST